jgi:hypothetical protein
MNGKKRHFSKRSPWQGGGLNTGSFILLVIFSSLFAPPQKKGSYFLKIKKVVKCHSVVM